MVTGKLIWLAEKKRCSQFRISGAEPILNRTSALHLAEVIRLVDGHFTIETHSCSLRILRRLLPSDRIAARFWAGRSTVELGSARRLRLRSRWLVSLAGLGLQGR